MLTLAVFTARRVLGLGRGARHKVLPAITLAIAFLPAFASVAFTVLTYDVLEDDLITYGEYMFIIGSALALFAALIAPEALCPDRRSGMLGLYLSGPLDRDSLPHRQGRRRGRRDAPDHGRPAALHARRVPSRRATGRPRATRHCSCSGSSPPGSRRRSSTPSLSMAVSSFTTRRAAAAVGVVLLLFVPVSVVRSAIESADAPNELDLLSSPFVAAELSYRIFGETPEDARTGRRSSRRGSSPAASSRRSSAGAFVCWLRYRRIEAFR